MVTVACGSSPSPAPTGGTPTSIATAALTEAPTATAATTEGALAEIRAAADATIAEGTVKLVQTVEFNGSSTIPDGTMATLDGATAFGKPTKLRASADFAALGAGQFDLIVDDQLLYMRGGIVEPLVGARKWLRVDLESDDPRAAGFKSLTTGQNDSSLLLYFLYGATDPVASLPDEDLNGQPIRRYSMPVDLQLALEQAPDEVASSLQANVASLEGQGAGTTLDAEVWIGPDALVHRVDYVYTLGATGGGGTMHVTCVFSDFGATLDLGIPDDADIVRLEDAG
jgi:hypothetical protein